MYYVIQKAKKEKSVTQHGLCATYAKFWKVIFAWYSSLATRAIFMGIAVDLVVCAATAA
jgi:hypothetical protein